MIRTSKGIKRGRGQAKAHAKSKRAKAKPRARPRLTPLQESIREAHADLAALFAGDPSRVEITTVRISDDIDVKSIRENLALSQSQFSRLFGIRLSIVKSWERTVDRRKPSRAARMFLRVLERRPQAVLEALMESE